MTRMTPIAKKLAAGALALAFCAASHAAYNVWTNEYSFSKKEIESAIAPQFPKTLRYMDIFQVNLSNPRLGMDAEKNRLTTVVDAQITNPFLQKPVNGVLTMSSAFKYDPATRAVKLDSPRVENVNMADAPPQYGQQLTALGNTAADQLLKDYPIYTFKPEQLEMNGKKFEPGKITVEKDAVKVEIKEQ